MKTTKFVILLLLSISQFIQAQSSDPMSKLQTIIGEYKLITYDHFEGQWTEGMETKSIIEQVHEGAFLKEAVAYQTDNMKITMLTYIGFDQRRGKYKLCAMDKEFQSMDIYFGEWQESKLVFTNLESDSPFQMSSDTFLHFRLSYEFTEQGFNHFVEATKDKGKTWIPFAKSEYVKQNS